MCVCRSNKTQRFSNVLHVAEVLFEQQDDDASLLSVLWEPVKHLSGGMAGPPSVFVFRGKPSFLF